MNKKLLLTLSSIFILTTLFVAACGTPSSNKAKPNAAIIKKASIQTTSVPQIKLRSTWSEVTTLQGTGNKTFTSPQISLSRLWGYTMACEGGHANVKIDTIGFRTNEGGCAIGDSTISGSDTPVVGPLASDFYPVTDSIQKITITAPPTTTWQLQFAKPAVSLPLLTSPGSDWKILKTLGSTGEGVNSGGIDDGSEPIFPKVWGIKWLCIGSGTFTFDMNAMDSNILHRTPACNNRIHFEKITDKPNAQLASTQDPSHSQDIVMQTAEGNDWQLLVVGCTNAETDCK